MTDATTEPITQVTQPTRPIRFSPGELPDGYNQPPHGEDDGRVPPEDPEHPDTGEDVSPTEGFLAWLRARMLRFEGSRREHPWCPEWWLHPEAVRNRAR
ncbi:hypothetical protein [Curtobacterium sp. MCLR17_054]|uniref:hypothetical protein n=1 Tax=Curtobacterium sp. MCLR17_054 TaxID=2175632 RepID=UPI000DAAC91B|nr:hypothetical protein [Curtobacterium sp. MCLR17_054]WIE70243.1 hypothetical protein DEJ08_018545 [Curtobacterium sp. MCLR17_054]